MTACSAVGWRAGRSAAMVVAAFAVVLALAGPAQPAQPAEQVQSAEPGKDHVSVIVTLDRASSGGRVTAALGCRGIEDAGA